MNKIDQKVYSYLSGVDIGSIGNSEHPNNAPALSHSTQNIGIDLYHYSFEFASNVLKFCLAYCINEGIRSKIM